MCNDFLKFFNLKIDNVRKDILSSFSHHASTVNLPSSSCIPFFNFSLVTFESLCAQVSGMKASTCILDPLPSTLFKSCFGYLCPAVLTIINDSLATGVVPTALKTAAVTPMLKKPNSDLNNLSNFHPISHLPFIAKILEGVVPSQLHNHLTINNMFEPLQYGFRKLHSTETALVKVVNDLLLASDSGALSILILLDLSSAFDTFDHMLLLNRLETIFGVSGTALEWFRSYFTGRTQFVFMDSFRSDVDPVCTGVPQGSVLGPLLFSIYIY
uniref:Reverse transcriptase domain-containing protein n=1 Tax=Cyprinus carpio TaxID=7962 RepID=A0A8C2DZ60_CYPCA